jgi:hypothetical protein
MQDVFFNPLADGLVQGADFVRSEALVPGVFLELPEKRHELLVGLLVFCVDRAPVAFHAILLKPEMPFGVGLEKVDQINQEIAGLHGGVGLGEQALEMIDVVNQHLMLLINRVRTGFELFVPDYHGSERECCLVSNAFDM